VSIYRSSASLLKNWRPPFSSGAGGLTDENEIPAAADVAVSKPGDIWQLGPHRVACGDCTDAGLVQALLAGAAPQLMVTDPPYGVEYDPEWRHRRGVNNSARRGKIKNDEHADWTATWKLFPNPDERWTLLANWRQAIAQQRLAPAPDTAAVAWKKLALDGGQHEFTDVKTERIERAIDWTGTDYQQPPTDLKGLIETPFSTPLDAIRRPRDSPIRKLEAALKCVHVRRGVTYRRARDQAGPGARDPLCLPLPQGQHRFSITSDRRSGCVAAKLKCQH
jgi:hypothetical protein